MLRSILQTIKKFKRSGEKQDIFHNGIHRRINVQKLVTGHSSDTWNGVNSENSIRFAGF